LALTTDRGQEYNDKMQHLSAFSGELEPIIQQLNDLLKKYEIYPIEDIILFPVSNNKIVPFISYERFPSLPVNNGLDK